MSRSGHMVSLARSAPFGTDIQPRIKTKIIGGKTVEIAEETPPSSQSSQRPLQTGPHGTPPMQYQPQLEGNNNSYNNSPNPIAENYRKIYSQTAPRDTSNSHIHSKAKHQEHRPGAHKVLPPITSDFSQEYGDDDDEEWSDASSESVPNIKDILQKPFPVHLGSSTVLSPIASLQRSLTEQVAEHLAQYDPLHFKEMYTDLAEFDPGLQGFVMQPQMNMIAHKHKLPIPLETLRLLFSNFAKGSNPDMVNYEKLIQFLARAHLGSAKAQTLLHQDVQKFVRPDPGSSHHGNTNDRTERLDMQIKIIEEKQVSERRDKERQREELKQMKRQKEQQKWKPSFTPKKPVKTFTEVDDAMLLCMLEGQFTEGKKKQMINLVGMREMCIKRDKHQQGTFTKRDLDDLFLFYRIPIQGSLLNKMLQRIDTGDGQLSWIAFLDILGKVDSGEASTPRSEKRSSQAENKDKRRASEGFPLPKATPPTSKDFQKSATNDVLGSRDSGHRSRDGSKPTAAGLQPIIEPRRPSTWPKMPIKDVLPRPEDPKKVSSPPWLSKPLARIEASNVLEPNEISDVEKEITRNDTPTEERTTPSPHPATPSPQREDYEMDQLRQLAQDHRHHCHHSVQDPQAVAAMHQKQNKRQREDWFKGFLHLAKGLYSTDTSKTGCLGKPEILRLVNNYNLIYQLGLSPSHIKRVVEACCHERDVVPIQPVLEILRQKRK